MKKLLAICLLLTSSIVLGDPWPTMPSVAIATGYTVATLPAGIIGMRVYVTDAVAPTFLGLLVGGGTIKCSVFFNGTAWVAD